ncbi:MAG: regulatory protein RecX [Saprospiraceae bacterium]|nr:regulatory protein RecX [Saprospiraceae bacterium]HNL38500.1 regulatory protein RecX [Saprospiraceae bacterium]
MPFQRKKTGAGKPIDPKTAQDRMERFCAFRERSPKEVRQKIAELGLKGEEADTLFDYLQEERFFNEERFAFAFAGGKFRGNHWGRIRIRMELQHTHGIRKSLIETALEALPEAEYRATLLRLLQKKRAQLAPDDPNARQKTAASAIRAGFEPELVFDFLD